MADNFVWNEIEHRAKRRWPRRGGGQEPGITAEGKLPKGSLILIQFIENILNRSFRRGGRAAEGAPLLREYMVYPVSRVRIPLSPPINKYRVNDPVFVYYWMVRTREEG